MFDHYSVMMKESINMLNINPEGIYVDMTLGGAGHSSQIYEKLSSKGKLICFDQDIVAIENAKEVFKEKENVYIINSNFANLKEELAKINITKVDGILFDLGVSSVQFDTPERGFSYRYDARLDMRMDQDASLSAYEIINDFSFNDIVYILRAYGDEKFAKQIARTIEKKRLIKPIETTFELVDAIKESLPQAVLKKKGHPAKKTFQALRIAVNKELDVFEQALLDAVDILNVNGRIAVITFHSGEDKICKRIFKQLTTSKIPKNIPVFVEDDIDFRLINTKSIVPSNEELHENNRSHSSRLRVIEKIKW
ncbi:16S rRNA (cytosine(1402)-N(4))-methyltransferase RsmH [Mycoplasma sp. P36-A1]|uniref:16S rRNA (cytosine(1402)-N(4))-methyltransferase RsmH n=1 Tax=Mycoplasma sp. P36-A1 TaxID=3252900 RepID=UPI003C2D12C6